jgi:hypothetical protein
MAKKISPFLSNSLYTNQIRMFLIGECNIK